MFEQLYNQQLTMNKQGELFHFEDESRHPEIIIYGDGTLRLDVRMENETVWLSQQP